MKMIRPQRVTDAVLVSSTVPEDDYPAWAAGTAYAVGDRVVRASVHRVFERAVAGTTATAPEADPINWIDAGPTNRWAMYDSKIGTSTTAADTLTVVLAPGRINSLALIGADANTVTVTRTAGAETVYSASLNMLDGTRVGNWYDYFYEPVVPVTTLIINGLVDAALLDIPAYGEGVLTVTLSRPGGTVGCALMVVGMLFEIGETEYGGKVAIRDYSQKKSDRFGNWDLQVGDYSKLMDLTAVVPADRADEVARILSAARSSNAVWIGSDQFGSLVVYGFMADWSLTPDNFGQWTFSGQVEGMT